jgi:hypothetical protein
MHIIYLHLQGSLETMESLVAMKTCNTQIVVIICHSSLKGAKASWKNG